MAKTTKKKKSKTKAAEAESTQVSIQATENKQLSSLRAETAEEAEAERIRKRNLGYI
jgi:hypothetical protein